MMRMAIVIAAAGVLGLAAPAVHAQAQGVQLTVDRGLYIGAGGGRARTGEGCLGACDTTDATWRVFAGYQFNRHFAVEAGYVDLGEATVSGTLAGVPVTTRMDTTAWDVVALGLLPLTDNFSIYGKFGLFRYDTDATTTGAFVGTSSDSGTEFTFGAGLQYSFTRGLAARFEWQRYTDVGTASPGMGKDDYSVWRLAARYRF